MTSSFTKKLLLFILFLMLILILRLFFFYQNRQELKTGEKITVEGTVASEPKINGNFQNFQLQLNDGNRVFITSFSNKEYNYQDRLLIIGSLEKRLLNNNELYTIFLPEITLKKDIIGSFLAVPSFIRQKIITVFNNLLPPDQSALLLGIVFGVRTNISDSFMQNLRSAGVLHVIAASGMNVTLVGGFLSSMSILFLKRQWAIILTIFGLFFYALLAGLQPSIIRATIMGCLVFSAQLLGRQYFASLALFLTAFIMLFISPFLFFDIGFQLSFLATLGLLYLRPIIDLGFSKTLIRKLPVIEDLTTTIAAQITTLPVLLFNFGSFSFFSIIINALVLWTIPILMVLGGLGAIFSFVFEPMTKLFIYLCIPLLIYFEKIVILFPKLSSNINQENIHWSLSIGYYLIIICLVLLFKKHEDKKN